MKAAAAEIGDLRSLLSGEAWSAEVLNAKFMKRRTLLLCMADPAHPVRVAAVVAGFVRLH
jgi:hypothetical protein